ncbi:thiamine ABC transporter ATP-binding protein [Neorhizobium vignae]|uniref:thiamine ABC transporter ATP-binding protein n=1 Tax=Neorhizobium vignae TaxID=690585 RepID=UPI00055B9294|nr:ATP-binding cassette domain-containing protein [Neorhizobium vignae]
MADGIVLKKVELKLGTREFRFDCAVPAGAVTAITGPSGSGKSTFLNLVAGFETPDRGHILIAGEDVTGKHPSERPVSLVFQDNNLFAHLDLATNIGLGINPSLKLSGNDRAAISQALERVDLSGFEKRMPGTLSGGERQRAAFARALVRKKPVLLMDEPFAALDPGLRLSMAGLLIDLHRETGNTVLIVTHDPNEVGRLADHAIFIDRGQILLQAPAEEFLARRDIPALAEFLSG